MPSLIEQQQQAIPRMAAPTTTPPESTGQQMTMGDMDSVAKGKEISPELQHKMDTYNTALMHIMHNPKTSKNVVDMLKAAPPEQSITEVSLQLTKTVSDSFAKKGQKVEEAVKLCGAMYLISDLSEIGNTAGLWEKPVEEKDVSGLLNTVVTKYIHSGLKDKSIDPIQLQADAEELFNDKQKEMGDQLKGKLGLPDGPTASMGIDVYAQKKMAPLQNENAELKRQLSSQQQQAQPQGGQV